MLQAVSVVGRIGECLRWFRMSRVLPACAVLSIARQAPAIERQRVQNALYLEVALFPIVTEVISANYERQVWGQFWTRAGLGLASSALSSKRYTGGGGLLAAQWIAPLGSSSWSFELGAGVSGMHIDSKVFPLNWGNLDDEGERKLLVLPAFFSGFRLHEPAGGPMLRLGLSWVYIAGAPFHVAGGIAF